MSCCSGGEITSPFRSYTNPQPTVKQVSLYLQIQPMWPNGGWLHFSSKKMGEFRRLPGINHLLRRGNTIAPAWSKPEREKGMPRSKSPSARLCYLAAGYIALLGICLLTRWTLFCWFLIGMVFGIPAIISIGFFTFFTAIALRWLMAGHILQGIHTLPEAPVNRCPAVLNSSTEK